MTEECWCIYFQTCRRDTAAPASIQTKAARHLDPFICYDSILLRGNILHQTRAAAVGLLKIEFEGFVDSITHCDLPHYVL